MDSILQRDQVGAFCRHTHVALKGSVSGPLAGLTFGVKDIYDIAGHRTGFGSPDWFATHAAAARTAPTVQRILNAGADMAGKTHTDELTYSLNGENPHYGTPVNVNAPGRIPGGSSSGSAAAVAAGLCDFALGSDTGGSVRAPASYCGIYGIRPTHGRVSLEGACPLAPSFDTAGWFAREATLLERVGQVLLGEARAQAPGRLLLARDAFELAGDAITQALQPAVRTLAKLLGEPE
ncbi:MAG TPA: amidase family protein, partial [Burkholderiales bacterium]|nr:amidase family protein [Burkholderiales bacterium]